MMMMMMIMTVTVTLHLPYRYLESCLCHFPCSPSQDTLPWSTRHHLTRCNDTFCYTLRNGSGCDCFDSFTTNPEWISTDKRSIISFLITIKQTGRAWHIVPFCLHESFSQLVSTMSHLSRTWFSKFGIWIWKRTSPPSVCILQILYMFYTCFTSDLQDHTKHRKCKKKRRLLPKDLQSSLYIHQTDQHIILELLEIET